MQLTSNAHQGKAGAGSNTFRYFFKDYPTMPAIDNVDTTAQAQTTAGHLSPCRESGDSLVLSFSMQYGARIEGRWNLFIVKTHKPLPPPTPFVWCRVTVGHSFSRVPVSSSSKSPPVSSVSISLCCAKSCRRPLIVEN